MKAKALPSARRTRYKAAMKAAAAAGLGEEGAIEGKEEEKEGAELVGRRPTLAGWETASEFSAFSFEGCYPSEDGQILAMPAINKIAEIPEGTAWSVAAKPNGDIYVGTGPQGRIYQFSPDGKQKNIIETGQLLVTSLAVSADGKVYAGTSPGAKIFTITDEGKAESFCELSGEHVWALRFDQEGNLLAGTGGERGRLYSITSDGYPSVIYEPEDSRHVISIDLDGDGQIYLGTAEPGRVIMLDKEHRALTLYETGPESSTQEIVSVAKWKGSVVFSTPDPALFKITEAGAIAPLGMILPSGEPKGPGQQASEEGGGGPAPFITALVPTPQG
jgi:hypothetical protein